MSNESARERLQMQGSNSKSFTSNKDLQSLISLTKKHHLPHSSIYPLLPYLFANIDGIVIVKTNR